jgi:glycosyltransferase involved in cell wall biosynthesis
MTPLVSILIPAYNEAFFPEALASARAQAYDAFEIVVCDDSPGTAIAESVAVKPDPRVRYVRNARRLGFEGNFTECLRQAHGDLAKFLNDDDRLLPGCVATLAAALDANPRVTLATSRRQVIDANGSPRPDIPATSPVSYVSCVTAGMELGDLALANGLNLIGEPSTVMFRRKDVDCDAGGIFTWEGKSYHCLADLSLWLRLLAHGDAYYCASVLSQYRVHPGQEQRTPAMGVECILERLDLANTAHNAGFLREPRLQRVALTRIEALATAWSARVQLDPSQSQQLYQMGATIAGMLGSLPL